MSMMDPCSDSPLRAASFFTRPPTWTSRILDVDGTGTGWLTFTYRLLLDPMLVTF